MSTRRGLSLIEVMIAIGVLAIGVLAVFGTLANSVRGESQAARLNDAVLWDRQLIAVIRSSNMAFNVPLPYASTGPLNDSLPAGIGAPFGPNFTAGDGFSRSIAIQQISTDTSDYHSGLVQITVDVFWSDHGAQRRVELQTVQRHI